MGDADSAIMLKEKLLTAGIDEILAHGIKDFSLRRVAAACGASCAAPYKHFKNKDEFIKEIIKYIDEKWHDLAEQIIISYDDPAERIAALCVANVRFKISNPLYGTGLDTFDPVIMVQTNDFLTTFPELCPQKKLQSLFAVSVITAGTACLMEEKKLANFPENFDMLKKKILSELGSIPAIEK